MAQIFAPHSFKASSINAALYRFLEGLSDDAVVLLEFISQGPSNRQVDCAILSSAGVDLLEVKDKRGRIEGYAAQPWTVTNRGYTDEIVNFKEGQRENPFEQAAKTASDFQQYLQRILGKNIYVYPLVVIPEAHPESRYERHHQTYVANGVDEIEEKLRAYRKRFQKNALTKEDIKKVVDQLGLSPVGIAILEGRVVDRDTRKGIAGVEVRFNGEQIGDGLSVLTDDEGKYQAALPVGTVEIHLKPAQPYEELIFRYDAQQGKCRPKDIELVATASNRASESPEQHTQDIRRVLELLDKERQEREALYSLLLEQSSQSKQSGSNSADVQKVIDELNEIRGMLNRLNEGQTPQEQQELTKQVHQFLADLAARAQTPVQTEAPAETSEIESRSKPPARQQRQRLHLALAVAAGFLFMGAGGWFLQNRPSAPTVTPSVVAASKPTIPADTKAPTPTQGSTGTATTPLSKTAGQQPQPKSNQSSTPVEPKPAQPQVNVSAPVTTTKQKPATSTPPASQPPVNTDPTPAAKEALPGVPIKASPQPPTAPVQETLPGIPIRQETATKQSPETLPGEPLSEQPLRNNLGTPPIGTTCPESHPVKGNVSGDRMIYHLPGQEFYAQTRPEACFVDAEEAARAGFKPSRR
jgi:hypothetical protein